MCWACSLSAKAGPAIALSLVSLSPSSSGLLRSRQGPTGARRRGPRSLRLAPLHSRILAPRSSWGDPARAIGALEMDVCVLELPILNLSLDEVLLVAPRFLAVFDVAGELSFLVRFFLRSQVWA